MDKYGIMFAQVPIDNEALKATPVPSAAVIPLFALPSSPNSRVEVLSVSLSYHGVVPIDATHAITGDVSFHDASADTDTVLQDDYSVKSTNTAIVLKESVTIWQGCQSFDPGDTLSFVLTVTTPDTAADGGLFTVAYRVKEWNGQ